MTPGFDENGNPDVMGARVLTDAQIEEASNLKLAFNSLYRACMGNHVAPAEAARLFAMARTHLEIACMCAVKAISRGTPIP